MNGDRMIKERPILFSSEMVKAILEGRKTQTRRIVKFYGPKNLTYQTQCHYDFKSVIPCIKGGYVFWDSEYSEHLQEFHDKVYSDEREGVQCPYGQIGDRLWVRETYHQHYSGDVLGGRPCYKADGNCINAQMYQWKPSIFMPRWASRISLEVVRVHVEKVQDISLTDINAEGTPYTLDATKRPYGTRREQFQRLWDSINEKRNHSWEVNPWVWVIEFKKVEG